MRILVAAFLCVSSILSAVAGGVKVVYKIEYIKVPAEIQGMESMLPQEMTMFSTEDSKSRVEQRIMGGSQIIVTNGVDSTGFILMDVMGQKMCITMSKDNFREESANLAEPELTYLNDTKTILGHECKLVQSKDATSGEMMEIYYAPDVKFFHQEYAGIEGFPMEYVTKTDGLKMRMTAIKLEFDYIPDSKFEQPTDGYTVMTMEEMSNMGMGK